MWQAMAGVVILITMTGGERELNAQGGTARLRPEGAAVRTLIDRAIERSATFRDLHNGLDSGNVNVYVRFARCSGGVPACLVWASADARARRLLIKLDRFGRSSDELTALLAHELQHANEVAADPDITDLASFQKSFAARGWTHRAGFETGDAIRVAREVMAELTAFRLPAPRRAPS